MLNKLRTGLRSRGYRLVRIVALSLIGLFLVSSDCLPGVSSAEQGVAPEVSLAITPSEDLSITVDPGVFGSITQTIGVTTTNYTGYTLSLETMGPTTDLVHGRDSTLVIPTITVPSGNEGIESANINNGYGWSLDGLLWRAVPEPGASEVLKATNAANSATEVTNLSFGVRVGETQPAGTYSNDFLISAVANDAQFEVTYLPNGGGDEVADMPVPATQQGSVSGLTLYLSTTIPSRAGYDFVGWATDPEATEPDAPIGDLTYALDPESGNEITLYAIWRLNECEAGYICYYGNGDDGTGTMPDQAANSNANVVLVASNFSKPGYAFTGWNTESNGNGAQYGPSETIRTGDLSGGGLKLYARWVQSAGILQNFLGCSEMSEGGVTALTDMRDGQTYSVAKLADGNCWITENLRLEPAKAIISQASTNGPMATFPQQASVSKSTNAMCVTNDAACLDKIQYNANNTNRNLTAAWNTNDTSSSWFSFGVMYNWFTATAGNGTSAMASGSVSGDICPSGWRMPKEGGVSEEMYQWIVSGISAGVTSDATLRKYPNNWVRSGDYNPTSLSGRGTQGRMWSASAYSVENAYRLGYSSDITAYNRSYNKWVGFPVRCVAKSDSSTLVGNIHYDANGGSGTMTDDVDVDFYRTSIRTNGFTHSGFLFYGWNTAADGSGIDVIDGDLPSEAVETLGLSAGDTLTLYARWGEIFTLNYDTNGGENPPESASGVGQGSYTFVVSTIEPTKDEKTFIGWSTDSAATTAEYVGGDSFTVDAQMQTATLYAVYGQASCAVGKVCYRANGAVAGTRLTLAPDNNGDVMIRAYDFSRTGFGFSGFNTEPDGSGTYYGANELISQPDLTETGLNIWAQWVPSAGTMQNWTGCSSMSTGDITALTDNRDGNTYTVAKLADGKCWMTENLRLDLGSATITSDNTNSPADGFATEVAGTETAEKAVCKADTSACVDQVKYDKDNINRELTASYSSNNNESSWFGYGVLYNWYTATAGNGTLAQTSGAAVGDICPKGWRLPTGSTTGTKGEIGALTNALAGGATNAAGSAALRKYPVNFVYGGDHNNGGDTNRGTYSRYWTNSAEGINAVRLGIDASSVTFKAYNKWVLFTMRCVADN